MDEQKRVLVGMSGGVDSSVAVSLLRDQGFECVGCTMCLCPPREGTPDQGASQDLRDARQVAASLGIEHCALELTSEFRAQVIEHFATSYLEGRTPNPCIECNKRFKFGCMLQAGRERGCWYIATGHYARIERQRTGLFALRKARDLAKDQSYVLYFLSQEQLAHVLLPLGDVLKTQAREQAASMQFVNADKPESMDICFVPDGDYAGVVRACAGTLGEPGAFVNTAGEVLGRHKGVACYTVGQRKGLGISGPEPYYVREIRPETNEVVVGTRAELQIREFYVRDVSWIAGEPPAGGSVRCAAKVRYRAAEQPATAYAESDGLVRVVFDEPQGATAPGQAAVLYAGEYVLGGGTIC